MPVSNRIAGSPRAPAARSLARPLARRLTAQRPARRRSGVLLQRCVSPLLIDVRGGSPAARRAGEAAEADSHLLPLSSSRAERSMPPTRWRSCSPVANHLPAPTTGRHRLDAEADSPGCGEPPRRVTPTTPEQRMAAIRAQAGALLIRTAAVERACGSSSRPISSCATRPASDTLGARRVDACSPRRSEASSEAVRAHRFTSLRNRVRGSARVRAASPLCARTLRPSRSDAEILGPKLASSATRRRAAGAAQRRLGARAARRPAPGRVPASRGGRSAAVARGRGARLRDRRALGRGQPCAGLAACRPRCRPDAELQHAAYWRIIR